MHLAVLSRRAAACLVIVPALAAPTPAAAGELAMDLGLQGTTTGWPDDNGGGATLDASWWFRRWIGASFVGKEHYASVDDRMMSYFSVNAALRESLGPVRLTGTLGFVHQHEEP